MQNLEQHACQKIGAVGISSFVDSDMDPKLFPAISQLNEQKTFKGDAK